MISACQRSDHAIFQYWNTYLHTMVRIPSLEECLQKEVGEADGKRYVLRTPNKGI